MKLVSIVIPVYNMGDKIQECVKALLKQTYANIEIILIDDGSNDDSYEKCLDLKNKDSRVIVIHTENQGSGPARNIGIEHAKGKYIYFPDADDYVETEAIEIMVSNMTEYDCDLVVFGYKNVNVNGTEISRKVYKKKVIEASNVREDYSDYLSMYGDYTIQGAPWNKFFDLEVIKNNSIRYPSLRRHQDEGFIASYVNVTKKICFISDVLYTYYVNDLKKEWEKYPVDYIEAVIGLYKERNKNIMLWNENDTKVHDLVYKEYICGIIKSFELSFSPKFKFNKKKRIIWIKKYIKETGILNISVPECLGRYQRIVIKIINEKKYNLLYIILKFKVISERMGIISILKK